jgi:hypothetical protein
VLFASGRAVEFFGGLVEFVAAVGGVQGAACAQGLHLCGGHRGERARDAQILPEHFERIDAGDGRGDGQTVTTRRLTASPAPPRLFMPSGAMPRLTSSGNTCCSKLRKVASNGLSGNWQVSNG